jgi:hypothetical protein
VVAATVNIEAYSDADLTQVFVYKAGGVAVDLTGSTLRMGIRRNAADLFEDLLLTTENGGLAITDAVNGVFKLIITDHQLVLLDGIYQHSLVRITPDALRLPIWRGQLVVNAGAARGSMLSGPVMRISVGFAAGVGTCSAIGLNRSGAGSAAGAGLAQATGVALGTVAGQGVAAGSGAAQAAGVGIGTIVGQGAAAGTGTATGVNAAAGGTGGLIATQVQINTQNFYTSMTSKSETGAPVGSGNCVIGSLSWMPSGAMDISALTSITDDKGNSYTIVDSLVDSTNHYALVTFIKWNITNAPSTITATFNNFYQRQDLAWAEYTGVAAGDPRDGHSINLIPSVAATADAATSGNFTTTVANNRIWAALIDTRGYSNGYLAGTGYTKNAFWYWNNGAVEDGLVSSAGTTSAKFTVGSQGSMSQGAPSDVLVAAVALKGVLGGGVASAVGKASATGKALATIASAPLHVSGGTILDGNNNPWRGLGIGVIDHLVAEQGAAMWTKMKSWWPHMKLVRLACYATNPPSTWAPFVNAATADGCYVVLEHHPGSDFAYTGAVLAEESAWYVSLARYYNQNPFVLYQTINEPGVAARGSNDQMRATYDALRGAGYTGMIFCEAGEGADGYSWSVSSSASLFSTMTNVAWDIHSYNWQSSYSTSTAVITADMNSRITDMQTVHSADGVMPCICLETGNSTVGNAYDAGGPQTVQAAYQNLNLTGVTAWVWGDFTGFTNDYNNLMTDAVGTGLTNYGRQVQAYIEPSIGYGTASGVGVATGRGPAPTSISRAQGKGANGGGIATTIAVTLDVAVYSGNFVCGAVSYNRNHTLSSVTDDKGNSYNLETAIDDTANGQKTCGFSRGNITNGPTIITATFADGTNARSIVVDEFYFILASTDPRDAHGGQAMANSTGTGANAVTSGNFTTTVNGDLLYGVEANVSAGDDGSTTVSAGTTTNATYALTGTDSGSSSNQAAQIKSEWAVQSAASATTAATFTHSAATGRTVFLISAKHA